MRIRTIRIIISAILFFLAILIPIPSFGKEIIYTISYLIVGYDIIKKALKNIIRGNMLDENILMTIATIGAFILKEYEEAVAVMLFYQIGELFQSYAVDKSRKSIASLMDIRPDYANLYQDNQIKKVDPETVNIDDIIIVKPGEKVPLDGIVIEGTTMLDTHSLTGESTPRKVKTNDEVLNGCLNQTGVLKIKVTKPYNQSTVSKILDLVENASNKKSTSENFITKFAKYYTPIVVIIAILIAIIPPMIDPTTTFQDWVYRALSFLVVSCPCALVISIPLSFFGGIGTASKMGILIKGSNYIEALSKTKTILFDKTGTLTEGIFAVQKIVPKKITKEELLEYATYAENFSNHPISLSLKKAYSKTIKEMRITDTQEIPGKGIWAIIEGQEIRVGNEQFMKENNIQYQPSKDYGTILYVVKNKEYIGYIVIRDQIKKDAKQTINTLRKQGINDIIMLTGDIKRTGEQVAQELGINMVYTELLPQEKVERLEQKLTEKKEHETITFVGDGVNDAPALTLADIGIAMGGLGSDAAIEASDIVIMTDEPSKINSAINLSQKTMRIVKQNIIFSITIKIVVLLLSAMGISTMWEAVFADVGVSMLAILNALRIMRTKSIEKRKEADNE